ncbi:MAG: hypothetical protein WCN86_02170 [bacterium]
MNTEPTPNEPNPNQSEQAEMARQIEIARQVEQADRFADQLLKLANARSHFLEERAKDMDIPKELSDEAFRNFETEQIEAILSRTLDLTSPWTKTGDDETSHDYFDSSGDTFIDTDNGIVLRFENTARSEDPLLDYSPLVESTMIYRINSMGRIEREVETAVEEIIDHATPHPLHGIITMPSGEVINHPENSTDEPVELDGNQARQFVDMLEKAIDGMIMVYSGPYWNISADSDHEGHFVIE